MSRLFMILLLVIVSVSCGGGGGGTTSYTISATAGDNGSASPASASVNQGSTTTITVTPDTGFQIDTVSGCGGSLAGNTYTTGVITADCTVTASFVAIPPTIGGFDFALKEGDFWEFGWDGTVSRFSQGSGGSTSNESGTFRLTLGAPSNIGGVTLYQILVSGNPDWGDTRDFSPRWTHIGIDSHKIYGSTDGATLEVVFDAETGAWSGGGFFSEWPSDTLIVAGPGSIDNAYITDPSAIMVGRSSNQSQCETIAGIVICGDQSFTSIDREFFKPGVGLLGYRFFNSFSFSGGGFSSGGSDEYDVGLIASSLRGDVVDYILENEPNNSVANAMPLTLPVTLHGDALNEGDTLNGGWTAIVLNTIDEVERNDSDDSGPTGAQVVTLPVMIRGTVSENHLGALTTVSPPGINTYQTSIEDWFHWQNDPQNLRFFLEYDASSGADLDIMVGGLSFFDSYGITNNIVSGVYQEEIFLNSLNQTSGPYRVVVDAFDTPNGPVDYTLRVDTFTTTVGGSLRLANEAPVADWFRVNLPTSQSLSINVSGGPIVVLTDATAATTLAVGMPATLGGNATIQTAPLAAGDYLIGVSDESVVYNLEVSAQ